MPDTPLHDLPQKAALLMQQAGQKGSRMADSEDLRQRLRHTTDPAHRRLDAQMGALDLHTREGFGQFLMAHAAGLAVAFPAMQGFVQGKLGATLPDLPALVAQDLTQIAPRASLPATPAPLPAHAGAGAAYVIIGSRLGTRVLAQRGFWGAGGPQSSQYMADTATLALWPALLHWMKAQPPGTHPAICDDALTTFAAFQTGLDLVCEQAASARPATILMDSL